MHWVVSCISNLAKGESEAAPKSRRLQMMARVRLDASHVSRCVTARREKVSRYIRVSQRTSEVRTFRLSSLRLRVLEYTERENWFTVPWEFLSVTLSIWWFGHWLERWSAIGRSGAILFFCRFFRWIAVKDGGWSGAHVDPSLTRQSSSVLVNRQDHTIWFVWSCGSLIACSFIFAGFSHQNMSHCHSRFVFIKYGEFVNLKDQSHYFVWCSQILHWRLEGTICVYLCLGRFWCILVYFFYS